MLCPLDTDCEDLFAAEESERIEQEIQKMAMEISTEERDSSTLARTLPLVSSSMLKSPADPTLLVIFQS